MDLTAFRIGDRVQAHPATDLFAMGDRYGTVVAITSRSVHVKMDKSGKTVRFASLLQHID